jgi:hypothetical protein
VKDEKRLKNGEQKMELCKAIPLNSFEQFTLSV